MRSSTISAEFTIEKLHKSDTRGPVRWIISHAKRYWHLGVVMTLGAFGNAALAAVVPVYIGQAYEAITTPLPDTNLLIKLALWIVITQIIRGGLQFGRNFGAEVIAQRIERDIRDELYISLLGKGMTFHSLQPVGDIMARATNDVREVNFLFSPGLNLVIGSGNFLLMPLLIAPSYHPSLIMVPALYIIGYFIALWQYLNELKPVTTQVRSTFGRLNTRLAEALDGIEIVKGTAQEKSEVEKFRNNATGYRNAFVKQGDIEARFIPLLLLGFAEASGFLHAILLYKQSLISLGDVIAFFGLLQLFGFPTFVSLFAYSQISLGIAGARRIIELLNKETELDQNIGGHIGQLNGKIEFKDVSFHYSGTDPAVENITFIISPGQTVAIVGQTGAGKTTLAKLINRTYDVTKGSVLIDGIDVRDWNLEALRQQISIIEQDIFLFSKTIAVNIAFGNPNATETEIMRAAKAAQAHDFISSFKSDYQTVIGERGVTLSGGQRQRLALARAFLTDPRILILDDSTSSIDSETEDKIQRAIYAASQGRTTFIITHRLSQIRWADQIIVLKQGKVAAIGSHEELMSSSPAYRQIFSQ
jgi:ATP-binding cassette, subfamily B, bacterial